MEVNAVWNWSSGMPVMRWMRSEVRAKASRTEVSSSEARDSQSGCCSRNCLTSSVA